MEFIPLLPRRWQRRRIGQRAVRERQAIEVLGCGVYDEARPVNVLDADHCRLDMLVVVNVAECDRMNNLIIYKNTMIRNDMTALKLPERRKTCSIWRIAQSRTQKAPGLAPGMD